MRRTAALLTLLALATLVSPAQRIDAVVNGAAPADARIGQQTIATIFGENLAVGECLADTVPLPTTLCGASAIVRSRNNSDDVLPVPLFYVSPTQWNVQIPANTDRGPLSVDEVPKELCIGSACRPVLVLPAAPGIFEWKPDGETSIAVVTRPDGSLVTLTNPAAEDELLVLWATGLGLDGLGENGPNSIPSDGGGSPSAPWVFQFQNALTHLWARDPVGTAPPREQEILFAGLTPGAVGLAQINFRFRKAAGAAGPAPNGFVPLFIERSVWATPNKGPFFGPAALLPVQ